MRNSPYRIAVVIPKYGLVGGAEGFAAQLTERFAGNRRYEIHVFANRWADGRGNITFHKVPIISFPKFLTTASFAYYTDAEIAKIPFDLIHTHDRIFAADLYTMHGIPHRIWVQEVRKKKRMSLFDIATQWVEKRLVMGGRCRKFLAVSQLTKEKFLQEYGDIRPGQVEVIHPGIDMERFQKHDRALCRKEIRSRFHMSETDTVILFASMNFDIRGLDHLMKGLAHVKAARPSETVKLLIVGKGNARKYSMLARDLGVGDRVAFTGIVEKETLEKIYLACDMFSILSQFDTFSMTTLEAMAASLPVVISSNVGAKDLVEEGVNGFVIKDTNDMEEIAGRIERMLDKSARATMAKAALKTAGRQSWSEAAQKVEEIYDEILKNRDRMR